MFWKNLMNDKEWRTEKWVVIALLASFILTGSIHFYSQKMIRTSTHAGNRLSRDYTIASKLKGLENHLLTMESNMQNYVLSADRNFFREIDRNMLEAQRRFDEIKSVMMDDPFILSESFSALEKNIQQKIDFNNNVLDSFRIGGKEKAEALIGSGQGALLSRDLLKAIQDFRQHEDINVLRDIQDGGNNNSESLLVDNVAYLLGIALLIFALGFFIQSLGKRMKLQKRLLKTKEQLEQSIKIKEQFLANMSHEIRTPLQTILGYTNRLTKEKLNSNQAIYVNAIQHAGENLLNIVNDILDISKMESGMMRLEKVPFSISGLMHSVDNMFQPKVIEKGIYLKLHLNPKIPDVLIGDPTRLTQILVNLINNAIKFTEQGGIDIYQEVIQKEQDSIVLKVAVQDSGIGISKDKLTDIFNRFEQADTKMTRIYGGSGLGLFLVKQLVDLQKGKVVVQSKEGKGSIFSVEIPYIIGTEKTLPKPADSLLVNLQKNFKGINILLVEDNLMNQRVVGMFLSDWGMNYDIADNGKTAIQQLEKHHYDLILMDVQMPEMDGYSATEYIRQNMEIETPIIAMTAHAFAGEREKAMSYGMDEYISKPVKEEDLYNIIAQFVPLVRGKMPHTLNNENNQNLSSLNHNGLSIDYNFLMNSSKGKRGHLKGILQLFLKQMPEELAAMDKAIRAKQFEKVGSIAHSMKSTSGYVGMDNSFRPLLESIERLAETNPEMEQLNPLYLQLKELVKDAVQKVQTEALPLVEK